MKYSKLFRRDESKSIAGLLRFPLINACNLKELDELSSVVKNDT